MSRSLRIKKAVDYTQPKDFEDDDDDFSSASLPPSKRSRVVTNSDDGDGDKAKRKPEKRALSGTKKSSQDTALNTAAKTARDERPSLDERLFERDLKKVLALAGDQTEIAVSSRESSQEAMGSANVNTDDAADDETGESSESAGESDSDDSNYKKPVRRSKAPRSTAAATAADRRGTKAAVARGSRIKGAARGARADVGPDPAPRQSPKRSPPPVLNKAGVTARATASRKPKWVPPAPASKNNGLSPGTTNQSPGPTLRLGLSKRAKLTPLHPGST
ncbi:RAD51-associated protein 1 [Lethenteron reissneri]|uniref:RAD51-associated protein 1 n=1 Tax=Lethenteron reissneri TaxID=7753 RepID=UPI002AB6E086|nr:RAD51-associated protein 1 [Lethenteron reissneri]